MVSARSVTHTLLFFPGFWWFPTDLLVQGVSTCECFRIFQNDACVHVQRTSVHHVTLCGWITDDDWIGIIPYLSIPPISYNGDGIQRCWYIHPIFVVADPILHITTLLILPLLLRYSKKDIFSSTLIKMRIRRFTSMLVAMGGGKLQICVLWIWALCFFFG